MGKTILAIAVTETHASDHFDKFSVHSADAKLEDRIVTDAEDRIIQVSSDLFNNFFNSAWLNSAILDQYFKSLTGNFSADRIKAGNRNDIRCIINDQIYTCRLFNCLDIAAFTTDDSSLHVFAWKCDCGNGSFDCFILGISL